MKTAEQQGYVEQVLAPTLPTDNIVVMDNLGSHKGEAIRRGIRTTGAKLFLSRMAPPNRSRPRRLRRGTRVSALRRASRSGSGRTSIWVKILKDIASGECTNYFVKAGYDPT
jgi:hypothetical protein